MTDISVMTTEVMALSLSLIGKMLETRLRVMLFFLELTSEHRAIVVELGLWKNDAHRSVEWHNEFY